MSQPLDAPKTEDNKIVLVNTPKPEGAKFLSKYKICAAPKIREDLIKEIAQQHDASEHINLRREVPFEKYPQYKELQLAKKREEEELKLEGKTMKKNTLNGYVELANFNDIQFEEQRRSYHFRGVAASTADDANNAQIMRAPEVAELISNKTERNTSDEIKDDDVKNVNMQSDTQIQNIVATKDETKDSKKKRRIRNDDSTDIDGYLGPWAGHENDKHSSKPSPGDAAIIQEYMEKRRKRFARKPEDGDATSSKEDTDHEKAQLHIKNPYDYQGRSFLVAPRDIDGVNLYSDTPPDGCRVPTRLAHTYTGHTRAITATRYFPNTAHLILSSSLDRKVKLWQLYKERHCIMTYSGHLQGVRDINFNNDGSKFLSASYDSYVKLWDTETGQCVNRFTTNKMAYCVKFNPDPEHSHLFLAGMANKKVVCWDTRTGELVQEYDRHLGAVNSITFVDENRKFVTTSDDKSLRVWEWDIPVDVKYIADPTLHSMPAVTPASNNRRLLCQSMDNKIHIFTAHNNKFKLDNKKVFRGHMVAGYACVPDFSCDMSLVVSGDADGKIFFWSWSSAKIITTLKAHDNACISVMWHPHERQKLVSAGWDNLIKIWE